MSAPHAKVKSRGRDAGVSSPFGPILTEIEQTEGWFRDACAQHEAAALARPLPAASARSPGPSCQQQLPKQLRAFAGQHCFAIRLFSLIRRRGRHNLA